MSPTRAGYTPAVRNHSHPSATVLLAASAFASGVAALVLQLQWGRQLALTFGGSHNAVAAVLTAFMLGLGLGSFIGGRVADRLRRPALAIGAIELALAALGPLLGLALVHLPSVAAHWLPGVASAGAPLFVASRFLLALGLLVVPTTLMGATYPILVRAASVDLDGLHRGIGRLYAANTLGGVAGVLLAGFAILPATGIPGSMVTAAAANLIAAGAAVAAYSRTAKPLKASDHDRADKPSSRFPRLLLAAAASSGALVLGAETLWHQALKMVLANSTTTLTLLLALTLAGLGLGAVAGAPLLRRGKILMSWAKLQLGAVALLIVQAAFMPEIATIVRLIRPETGWARVLVPSLVVGGALVLPATLLFGAAWPLLLKAATPRLDDGGRNIGRMGIVNSVGAAVGAALFGLVILPQLGFGRSMLALAGLGAALVILGLRSEPGTCSRKSRRVQAASAIACVVLVGTAVATPSFGRVPLPSLTVDTEEITVLSYQETASGTVVVTENSTTGTRAMYVDNNSVIGDTYDALKVARMLGLVPTLLHPDPQRALVIGFGAGVTTATVAGAPGVQTIDVVEIVPGVVDPSVLPESQSGSSMPPTTSRPSTTALPATRECASTPTTAATTSCSTPDRGMSSPATRSTRSLARHRCTRRISSGSVARGWRPGASFASTSRSTACPMRRSAAPSPPSRAPFPRVGSSSVSATPCCSAPTEPSNSTGSVGRNSSTATPCVTT